MTNISSVDSNTTTSTPTLLRRNARKEPCDLDNRERKKGNMLITPRNAVSLSSANTNGEKGTFDRPPAANPRSSGQSTGELIHNKVNAFLSSQISEGTNPSVGAENGDSTAEASFTNDIDCAVGLDRDEIEDSRNITPGKPTPNSRNDSSTKVDDTKPMASAKASDSFLDGMDSGERGNFLINSASTNENTLSGVGRNTRTPVSSKTAIETSPCHDSNAAAGTLLENTQNAGTQLTDSPLPNEDASVYCDKEANTRKKSAKYLADDGIDESADKTTLVTSSEISQTNISQKYDSEEEYERNLAKALDESKKQFTANREDDKIPCPNENYDAELQKALMESQKQLEIDTKNRKRKIELSCKTSFDDSGSVVDLVSDGPDSDDEYSNQLKRAMEASLQDEKSSVQSTTGRWEIIPPLGIESFENAVESFMNAHGGFQKIESGAVICEGNNRFKKKSDTCGGENQERAQYGRITIEGFQRVIDKLEGRPSLLNDEKLYNQVSEKGTDGSDDTNNDDKVCNGDSDVRDPEGRKIKAFVDIGHGLGIQVMQVGLCLGVPSRGVELMRNRHMLAKELESDLKNVFSAHSFETIELVRSSVFTFLTCNSCPY